MLRIFQVPSRLFHMADHFPMGGCGIARLDCVEDSLMIPQRHRYAAANQSLASRGAQLVRQNIEDDAEERIAACLREDTMKPDVRVDLRLQVRGFAQSDDRGF